MGEKKKHLEKRVCYVCSNITMIESLQSWKEAKSIVWVEASRKRNGKITQETHYYVSSLSKTVKERIFHETSYDD
jgi:3-phenylpropionate/cinnamic acid dioxygenase small subunit